MNKKENFMAAIFEKSTCGCRIMPQYWFAVCAGGEHPGD